MAKYLVKVSYTAEGTKGLIKEGGSGRRAAVQKTIEGMGGSIEAFYYALGDTDAYLIMEFASPVDGLALSMAVNASGGARVSTVPLVSIEDVDAACRKSVAYRPPGT